MAKPDPWDRVADKLDHFFTETWPELVQRVSALEIWVRVLIGIGSATGLLALGLLVEMLIRKLSQ